MTTYCRIIKKHFPCRVPDKEKYKKYNKIVYLKEIKEVLAAYFARKVDDEMDALCNEGKIDADVIEAWGKEHMRTPYK